jgi:hypothetical protein
MPEKSDSKNRGCFFYGCLTAALVVIGVVIGLYFGTRKAIKSVVASYTFSTPASVPQLKMSDAEKKQIAAKIEEEAKHSLKSSAPLTLNETKLNVLLEESPELQKFSRQIYLKPAGTNLEAQLSLPLDELKSWQQLSAKLGPSLKGRYLNGTATLAVAVTNGVLNVHLKDFVVKGKSLPSTFTSVMEPQNLAADANKNANLQSVLARIRSVEVTGEGVTVHFLTNRASAP